MGSMIKFLMAIMLSTFSLGIAAQDGYQAAYNDATMGVAGGFANLDVLDDFAENAIVDTAGGSGVMREYASNFPHSWRRKRRSNREIVLSDALGERAMIFRRDSLIIGSSVFKLERHRGTRYLVNQSDRDTIGSADRRWRNLTIDGYGTLTRVKGRNLGYNLIYSDAQGVEVARVRHARFDGVNEVRIFSKFETITPLLLLSAMASLREVELEEDLSYLTLYFVTGALLLSTACPCH